jgi:YD repeat-containing protein
MTDFQLHPAVLANRSTFDSNGNTQSKTDSTGTTQYAWDFENRLTSVTLPGSGGTVSFGYNPFGRRIKKVTSTTTSVFAYDGDNLIEETNSVIIPLGGWNRR